MDEQPSQEEPEQSTHSEQGTAQPNVVLRNAPYEVPLTKAFDKLTSQIFLFLLAYVILLIGLAVFGSSLVATLRNLLYILPVLGVIAYLWQQQRAIAKDGKGRGIDVKAGKVTGDARVGAIFNAPGGVDTSSNIGVRVRDARDRARVVGVEFGSGNESNDEMNYLVRLFQQLSKQDQRKLIASAQTMLDKQEPSDD
jgi:hypothetical protein